MRNSVKFYKFTSKHGIILRNSNISIAKIKSIFRSTNKINWRTIYMCYLSTNENYYPDDLKSCCEEMKT